MTADQIRQLVHQFIPETSILILGIELNQYNEQLDKLQIVFQPDLDDIPMTHIGDIIDALQSLTIADEYGDLTELKFEYSSYYELPQTNQLTMSWTFLPGIDS